MENIQNHLAKQMTYDQVKEGEEKTDNDYVTFDAFFLKDLNGDGTPEKVRGTCKEVFTDDDLYLELNVKTKGYLKDAKIDIGKQSSRNYYFNTELAADSQIKQDYVADDTQTIEFNKLNNGTHLLLSGKVRSGRYEEKKDDFGGHLSALTPENLSMKNNIVFTGTWVEEKEDGTTQEVPISKTVPFQVDWYGTNQCDWDYKTADVQTNQATTIIDKTKQQFNLAIKLYVTDTVEELLVKDYTIEGTLPQINGYDPISVTTDNDNTINYDTTTHKFSIKKQREGTNIQYYQMGGTLKVAYPLAAYEGYQDPTKETIQIPVKGYFNSYNNPNPEFKNPYPSNEVEKNIKVNIYREVEKAKINIKVGSQVDSYSQNIYSSYIVSKQKPTRIYNGLSQQESKDYYKVTWEFYPNEENSSSGVIMREKGDLENTITKPNDQFVKKDNSEISMENVTKNIGIYFGKYYYISNILGENGWVKVYNDDTNELIETFDIKKMEEYNSESSFYHYASPIAHVRIETSAVTGNGNDSTELVITHVKELNDAEIIKQYPTKAEFDQLKYIKSHVAATTDDTKAEANDKALYTYPFSVFTMNLGENRLYYKSWSLSTQQEKDMKITIASDESDFVSVKNKLYNLICPWQNGEYLLKMPKDIIGLTIQNVTTNQSDVKITHYETFEKEGNIYIKIQTKNTTPTYYQIVLNAKVTPNPASPSQDEEVELYAYNQNAAGDYEPGVSKDVYDVNGNSNVEEQVGYLTRKIGLISSNSLLTGQKATQYDNAGNIAISPRIAKVDKNQRTANIGISIVNNYSSTISGITILGTIPKKGNQYILNQNDLGSTYSTTMNSTGIQVPEELKNYTKVYYSEQEKPTKDLTNSQNGWTTTPTDWSKIKSYLIDLGDYVLPQKQSYLFEYQVNIPEGLAYNDVSYAQHGVYFFLDTKEGKYATETEPAKLGLLITKEFDLNLTKYHVNTKDTVQGATYQVADEEGNKVTGITDEKGNLILKGLLVGRAYTLKETISPTGYDLNPDEVKFKIQDNANGGFDLVLQSGTVKDQKVVTGTDGSVTLQMAVEDTKPGDFKTITVHHYIYDATTKQYTTNKVMLKDGTFAKDETKKGLIGSSYTTEPLSNIYKMYQLYETPKNANGTFTEKMNDIYYYYVLKPSMVTGKTTKMASTGQTTEDQKPLLTDERGEITYTIHATGTIQDYKGNAMVKIIDQLPASIDTTKSDLAGGVYSPTDKTITWTETMTGIDVFDGQKYPYDLTKKFKVVYTDQDVTKPIVNTTYGQIILYQPDQSEKSTTKITEATSTVEQAYQTNIETKKIWNDQSNKAQKRPSSVTFKLEGNGQSYTKELTAQNAQADNANIWSVTFTDLPKYDSKGNLIPYTLSEENVNNLYYDSANTVVDQQAKTITNTFAVPGEKVNVPVTKVWDDQNNQAGKRPNGVTITIRGNGLTREHTLTAEDQVEGNSNKWQYTFTDLPKYDENGNDVNYKVAEKDLGNIYYTAQNAKVDQQSKTITNTFAVPADTVNVAVQKVWDDQENAKNRRPNSVSVSLLKQGNVVENTKVELTQENEWKHTYENLPKYDENGNEFVYSVQESETNSGDLEYYEAPVINGTNPIIITNRYKTKKVDLNSKITKESDATITNSQQEISYTIHYTATVNNYIGQAKVTIVDNLPYPIDTEKSQLDGGVYDENKKTIIWTENIEHINTDTSKQAYAVDITKNIQVVYKNLDASQENISNEATGTIQFLETEASNEVKTEKEVPVQIMGKVVAKYVDQDTKEEIETAENMEGKVGTEYTTVQKEIPNYDFVESSGNTTGHYQEGNAEVTYYYRKTPAKVIVKYVNEKGEELAPSETIDGYVTKPYETKEKEIENYVMDHVVGETKGDMTKEDITITYVYHKAKAEVIVKYLEKKTEKELAPSETISGVVGDAFETSRKTIPNYRAVDPEPKETKGNMVKGTTEIIYYYEEIPNGTVNIKYWDADTNQEITYVNEKGKTTNYGYTIIGKIESDYQAEEKTIPYYDIVENRKPDNASGKIEEGKTTEVNYYYKKKIFNLKVQKKVVSFIVNGEEKTIENANKSKIEIHRKEIDNTNLQVKYQIIAQNDGGIEGTAKVVEKIPAGFQVASGTSSEWVKDTDGNLSADVKLQPNETKTWEVILDWEKEEDNFGKKINQVTLTNLQNPAGFDETNAKDNTAEADVYVAIATGKEVPILIIVLSFFTVAGALILGYEYECYRKESK